LNYIRAEFHEIGQLMSVILKFIFQSVDGESHSSSSEDGIIKIVILEKRSMQKYFRKCGKYRDTNDVTKKQPQADGVEIRC